MSGLGSMFYLSQRPYLVSGTLRDQLLYPQPPQEVWKKASEARHATFAHLRGVNTDPQELDSQLETVLEAVELDYLLARSAVANFNQAPGTIDFTFHFRVNTCIERSCDWEHFRSALQSSSHGSQAMPAGPPISLTAGRLSCQIYSSSKHCC